MSKDIKLGERIVEAREASGLSTAQLARRMAVKTRTLRNWEYGATSPRPNKLQMLAGVLGVPLLWLVHGDDSFDPVIDRPGRLDLLKQKVDRMNALQRKLTRLSTEICDEIAMLQRIDDELEELAA